MMEIAASVEAERRLLQNEADDDDDGTLGDGEGFRYSKKYTGELTEEDDLVMAMRDGMGGDDSPWPLTDLYRFLQAVCRQIPESAHGSGTLTIKALFVPKVAGDED